MEEARREGAPRTVGGGSLEVDVAALVAHTRRLGVEELDELASQDRDLLDIIEETLPPPAVSAALERAMLAVEDQLRPLVDAEAWALCLRRCELATAAESVSGAEEFTLGLVLGAAWQYRATLGALHEWLLGGVLPDPGHYAPVDHQAAMTAAYRAADNDYEELRTELEGAPNPATRPAPG